MKQPARLIIFATSTLLAITGCSRRTDEERRTEIQEAAEKLVAERALLDEKLAERRAATAADLQARAQARTASREELIELAATEQSRREMVAIDIRDTIDRIVVGAEMSSNNGAKYIIDNQVRKNGDTLQSASGYHYTFEGKTGDMFVFTHTDDGFTAKFQKAKNGPCIVTVIEMRPLAEGIPAQTLNLTGEPSQSVESRDHSQSLDDHPRTIGPSRNRIVVLSARYKGNRVEKDVKPLIKKYLQQGRSFNASNGDMGGDPEFGVVKTLYITFTYNGRRYERSYREGEQVTFP
jgi:hypothetical protein